jgi:hypothetical protein
MDGLLDFAIHAMPRFDTQPMLQPMVFLRKLFDLG